MTLCPHEHCIPWLTAGPSSLGCRSLPDNEVSGTHNESRAQASRRLLSSQRWLIQACILPVLCTTDCRILSDLPAPFAAITLPIAVLVLAPPLTDVCSASSGHCTSCGLGCQRVGVCAAHATP